jgi:hypothetical protein
MVLLSVLAGGYAARPAWGAEAMMTVELPAGRFKAVRLRNLPKDAVMAVGIQSSGKLLVLLLNEQDAKRFPKPEEPVFAGSADRRLSFTVTIPAAGHYFLVLDNRQGSEPQKLKLAIKAERGRIQQPPQPGTPAPLLPPADGQKGLDKL